MTQHTPPQSRANRDDILKVAQTLFPEGSVVELRALDASTPAWRAPHTEYGYYSDMEALATDAAYMGECAPVVYFTLNEVDPRLLNRAANKLRSQVGNGAGSKKATTTSDKDIQRYRYLLVDCDPKRPADIAASDAEHEAARENPARICKLYGTRAANKGDDTMERPHRVSELRKAPKGLHTTPVTLEQLQAVAATLPEEVKPERKGAKASAAGPYDMEALIERHPDGLQVVA
jgi:hypothetical protein